MELCLEKKGDGKKLFLGATRWPIDPFLGGCMGATSNVELGLMVTDSKRKDDWVRQDEGFPILGGKPASCHGKNKILDPAKTGL
jgi:hypothetical protein